MRVSWNYRVFDLFRSIRIAVSILVLKLLPQFEIVIVSRKGAVPEDGTIANRLNCNERFRPSAEEHSELPFRLLAEFILGALIIETVDRGVLDNLIRDVG